MHTQGIRHTRCFGFVAVQAFALLLAAFPMPVCALDVWVDFTSDFHDGSNGSSNGVADWIDELNQATSDAGVSAFNSRERNSIEGLILSQLRTIFDGYSLNFSTLEPAGEHDVIYMARDNDHPNVSSSNRGSSPVDIGNQDTNGYSNHNGNPSGVPKVTTGNFDSHLELSDTRSTQILEIGTALAGTAAHELGHSFGLLHHFVYSHTGISPANYDNTGGVQNEYIMGTGNTGVSEAERESTRLLSPFSRVMMDIAGGSRASSFEENNPLVAGFITSDRSEDLGEDAGASIDQAWPLSFSTGPTSGTEISFVEADLDDSDSDVDVYQFSINAPATLVAQVFSERLDLSTEFDPVLALLDSQGSAIATADDIGWDDDKYNDLISPEAEDDDPILLNYALTPGTYYLSVEPTTEDSSDLPNPGDHYWLITSLLLSEAPILAGDFNDDGLVDAVDYAVWRENLGAPAGTLPNDPDDTPIGAAQYAVWRSNYGATQPSIALAVPEPATLAFLLALAVPATTQRRSRS